MSREMLLQFGREVNICSLLGKSLGSAEVLADLWVLWFEKGLCSRHPLWGVMGTSLTSLMGKELLANFVL